MLRDLAGKVYRPDHTAHLRAGLAQSAVFFGSGLGVVLATVGTGLLAVWLGDLPAALAWLGRMLWIVGGLGVTASLAGLASVGVRWRVYRRRRADLDAAGAEALGEMHARMASRRRP